MKEKQVAPYGSWKSRITSEAVYASVVGISGVHQDGDDLYWGERRPDGRTVLVRRKADGGTEDLTPAEFNVRSRVHEYGGGDTLAAEGGVYFVNFNDQHLYRQVPGAGPVLAGGGDGMRYADFVLDGARKRLISVREDHTTGAAQAVNTLAAISLEGGHEQVLAAGNDFYSSPRLSPDGRQLAWLTWNHPDMPWDGTELWVSDLQADGSPGAGRLAAGGRSESVFQPKWSPDGRLYFVSDRSGWWNLYRWEGGAVEPLHPMEAEFGRPQWVMGISTYDFASPDRLVCTYAQEGRAQLAVLDTRSLDFRVLDLPYTAIDDLHARGERVIFVGGSAAEPAALLQLDLSTGGVEVLRREREVTLDPAWFSMGQKIEFPSEGGLSAHGYYYPPANPDFRAPAGERPPLRVISHGGPTSATTSVLRYSLQYWTSRGFAVLDVDYGGSTGYGRAYRERLKGQWGIVDVADCLNGARYLVGQGLADGERLTIAGGSAGGYTTLCALTFHDTFQAGASYYGVCDLEALAKDTHKFESRYLDSLVGAYPEQRELYLARSPIHHTDRLACPMIILQGLEDPVVPPNQAQMMFEALLKRKVPVAYLTFAGERHGFRVAENNQRALEAEFHFYSRVFHFEPADAIEPVRIENLAA